MSARAFHKHVLRSSLAFRCVRFKSGSKAAVLRPAQLAPCYRSRIKTRELYLKLRRPGVQLRVGGNRHGSLRLELTVYTDNQAEQRL